MIYMYTIFNTCLPTCSYTPSLPHQICFFHVLYSEHQELAEQLKRLRSEPSKIQDHTTQWEKQLELLIVQMEAKRKQIRIVSRQLQGGPRKASVVYCHKSQELMNPRATSLTFLQNMKTIQKTLRQDDLSWD